MSAAQCWLATQLVPFRYWERLASLAAVLGTLLLLGQAALLADSITAAVEQRWNAAYGALPGLGLLWCGRALCGAGREWAAAQLSLRVRQQLRQRWLIQLEQASVLPLCAAELSSTLLEHVEALDGYLAHYRVQQQLAVVQPLLIVLVITPYSWLAALLLLLSAPLIPLFMVLVGYAAEAASQQQLDKLRQMSGRFLDLLHGLSTLSRLGQLDQGALWISQAAHDYRQRSMQVLRLAFLSSTVLELFASLGVALVAVYLGLALLGRFDYGHYGHALTLHSALFMLLLAPEFYAPLRQLSVHYHAKAQALAAVPALSAAISDHAPANPTAALAVQQPASTISDHAPANPTAALAVQQPASTISDHAPANPTAALAVQQPTSAISDHAPANSTAALAVQQPASAISDHAPANPTVRGLSVQQVSLIYPDGRRALQSLNLTLQPSERIALIGPSGAGKSSVLQLLLGHPPSSGTLHWDGQPLPANWSERLLWIGQRPHWFPGRVRDNLRLADPHADSARLWTVLEQARLADAVAELPQGLDTPLAEHGAGLSGGQLQRLALARALLRAQRLGTHALWLLDEPSAHLDPESAAHWWADLAQLTAGQTLVVASHQLQHLGWLDRVVELRAGALHVG